MLKSSPKLGRTETVRFLPSQIPGPGDIPLPYTATPSKLLWSDAKLTWRCLGYLPQIVTPFIPRNQLDEIWPVPRNILIVIVHTILVILELIFLVSLPFTITFPAGLATVYIAGFLLLIGLITRGLNSSDKYFVSQVPLYNYRPEHEKEHWIFLNGVGVGKTTLQENLDRLSITFGRRIHGIHNLTDGILFDLIECLIQRNFCYATQDIRDAYEQIKAALLKPKYEKIVLILHSQGGIEGSLIIDWLLAELPQDAFTHLEIYTFGNAANHFNNPCRSRDTAAAEQGMRPPTTSPEPDLGEDPKAPSSERAIRYVEHYANTDDFVSRLGVLNYANVPNRYAGRIFERYGSGHLINQHYLDHIFPLNSDNNACEDVSSFMETEVELGLTSGPTGKEVNGERRESLLEELTEAVEINGNRTGNTVVSDDSGVVKLVTRKTFPAGPLKVKHLSRLWMYRNGMSPPS